MNNKKSRGNFGRVSLSRYHRVASDAVQGCFYRRSLCKAQQLSIEMQRGSSVQYFAPGGNQFVGDCMPWYHDGTFHLFYLLDEGHHQGLGGLGGHQWAHASTRDLVRWQHHPLALPLAEPWEG